MNWNRLIQLSPKTEIKNKSFNLYFNSIMFKFINQAGFYRAYVTPQIHVCEKGILHELTIHNLNQITN